MTVWRTFFKMTEFIEINIAYETKLLNEARNKYGTFSPEYRKRFKQLEVFKERL